MIRGAEATDADAIASIYNYYIAHTIITFEEERVSPDNMLDRIKKVERADLPWLVAENEGKVIGYAYGSQWSERSAYRYTAEVSVYIAHDSLGGGWGTRLYEALFDELRRLSIRVVIGGVALPNAASEALHEKFGMRKVAHFERVGFKHGQWIDVGYWQVDW